MKIQISAGQGPVECQLAAAKLVEEIRRSDGAKLIQKVEGDRPNCYRSAILAAEEGLEKWLGTVQWICQSPFRPKHKRKNWFVDVSRCADVGTEPFDETRIRFETFRSSGNGGQHVNRTESGVRAIYLPTGDTAISTDERSQLRNKQIAVRRIRELVEQREKEAQAQSRNHCWEKHTKLERGNAVAVFCDMEFIRKK